jgi:nicotinamidase-related amidase
VTEPERTALVFVECQNGVVGDLATMGRLAAGARSSGVHVAHLTYLSAASGRSTNRRSPLMRGLMATAEWNETHPAAQVVPEIGVGPDDLVLPRHQGISPIHRTETLAILRNMGIEEIVVAGVSTNLAVPLVAVGAADEDFAVTIPTDACIGTPLEHHASMLKNSLAFVARLTTVGDLLAEWAT